MRIKFVSENTFNNASIGEVVGTRCGLSGCETKIIKISNDQVGIQFISTGKLRSDQVITWRSGFGLALIAGGKHLWVKVKPGDWVAAQALEGGYLPPKVWKGWEHVSVIEPLVRRIEFSGEDYDAASWDETHYHVEAEYRPWFAVDEAGNEIEGSSPKELEALPKGLYLLKFYGTDNQGQYRWYGLGITGRKQYRYWSR